MSTATRKGSDARVGHYLAQTGSVDTLTPAQHRRVTKRLRQELSAHAGIVRTSRLRKAFERKRRREVHAQAANVVGLVQRLRNHR